MVGALKKWLGIEALERENLTLARTSKALLERVAKCEEDIRENLATIDELRKSLTSEPAKPKIVPKTARSWSAVQSAVAAENAKIEREEA